MTLVPPVDFVFQIPRYTLFLVKISLHWRTPLLDKVCWKSFFVYDISSTGRLRPSIPEEHTFLGKKKIYFTGVHLYSLKSDEYVIPFNFGPIRGTLILPYIAVFGLQT